MELQSVMKIAIHARFLAIVLMCQI